VAQNAPKPRPARGERTRAVHGATPHKPGPMTTPIVRSATFSFASLAAMNGEQDRGRDSAYYQRIAHPTVRACERRLAELEGAEDALLFASGMAAISAAMLALVGHGDHVVAMRQSYGGTQELLKFGRERFGWTFDLVDARKPETWGQAFKPRTRVLHVESPTNPVNEIVDLAAAAELAHARGARLTVDNTFASPVGQRPLEFGADLALYSATKSIGGHADLIAGAATGSSALLESLFDVRKTFGPIIAPEVASVIERSLKTLPLRVAAQNANALDLAQRLAAHPGVAQVMYAGLASHPRHALAARQMKLGFGPVVAFDVRGGASAAEETVNAFQLVRHAPSLGGVESLASLPAFTSHVHMSPAERAEAGIPEGTIRLSVGIEDPEDLWADLDQALARAAAFSTSGGPAR